MKAKYKIVHRDVLEKNEGKSQHLQELVRNATTFIQSIKGGDLDASFEGIDSESALAEDSLGGALLAMRQKLKKFNEEENQRRWAVEGIAHFADILRSDYKKNSDLYATIIAELVKHVKANQGSLFVLNDDDPKDIYLNLEASYAYDKRKYLSRRIEPGQGLVGQSYLEKDEIFLTEVPQNYVQITSGLGLATPRCILVFPIMVNEQVLGIIELASFKPFESYEREFMKKLGESIASAISNAKINYRNKSLLELSQEQTAQMQEQEEEMRQNMEELQATQEEMQRKMQESLRIQEELDARMAVLNKTALLTESDLHGTITFVNDKFCHVSKWRKEEAIGKAHNIVRHPDNSKELYKEMWSTIKSGQIFQGRFANLAKDGSTYWVDATIAPVLNASGEPIKYIGIRFDITDQVGKENELKELVNDMQQQKEELQAQEEELRQNLEELSATQEEIHRQFTETDYMKREMEAREQVFNITSVLSESDNYGNILMVNDKLCEVSQYGREELIGKPHNIFRHPDMPKEVFELMWSTIKKGEVFRGIIKNRRKDGGHYWVDAVISPVLDEHGKPVKYIGARYVIPDDSVAELLFNKMLEKFSDNLK